jgi:hypothetical protein
MRDTNYPTTTTTYGVGHLGLLARLAPLIVMLALTLFPFGWLGELWPAFGHGLDLVFSNDQRHAIGHGSLFCLLGLLTLMVIPRLRARPWRYAGLLVLAGVGQEFFQMLYKQRLLLFDDSRDLLTDLAGIILAFVIVWSWQQFRARRLA